MTVTSPMEGITAPARKATNPPPLLPLPDAPTHFSRRADGWSAANQRTFLEGIAEGHGVDVACARVGLSASSAYAFRRTAKGAAFALGWRAASLVARDAIAETLLVRALEGQVETYIRGETVVTRHRHDNRLAMSLLARLDRQVEATADADVKAARLVAQEFDAFLDLVGRDEGPARAGLFLARRAGGLADAAGGAPDLAPIFALAAADRFHRTGVATAGEVAVADLDPAERAHWTAEQWARAEAAGLLALAANTASASQQSQHSPAAHDLPDDEFAEDRIWWDGDREAWRTGFPPPPGFDGDEEQERSHVDYNRELTAEEAAVMGAGPDHYDAAELALLAADRDAFFADRRAAPAIPADAPLCEDAPVDSPPGSTPMAPAKATAAPPAAGLPAAASTSAYPPPPYSRAPAREGGAIPPPSLAASRLAAPAMAAAQ